EALLEGEPAARMRLVALVRELLVPGKPLFLASATAWRPDLPAGTAFLRFEFAAPSLAARRELWSRCLNGAGAISGVQPGVLASKFPFGPERIRRAAGDAAHAARLEGGEGHATCETFHAACRGQSGHTLRRLAQKVRCVQRWQDLVLPPRALQQLREIEY